MGPFAEELVAGPASANTARVCCGYAPRTRSLPPSNMVDLPLGFGVFERLCGVHGISSSTNGKSKDVCIPQNSENALRTQCCTSTIGLCRHHRIWSAPHPIDQHSASTIRGDAGGSAQKGCG
jgi:hypothetical protein